MGIFGKKARKSFEERAKELNIALAVPSGNGYEKWAIKGAGETIEAAENRLLEKVIAAGETYLSNIDSPKKIGMFRETHYVISAIVYRQVKGPTRPGTNYTEEATE